MAAIEVHVLVRGSYRSALKWETYIGCTLFTLQGLYVVFAIRTMA